MHHQMCICGHVLNGVSSAIKCFYGASIYRQLALHYCMQLFHFTLVQLATTAPGDYSLNGYMVAPREDTGATFDGSASYVGSWETGIDMKLLCNRVSTSICQLWYIYYDPMSNLDRF